MPKIAANGLMLEYEVFGDPARRAVLLIQGFRTQMIGWDGVFCEQLAARGYQVVRFDNRDVGLSSKVDGAEADLGACLQGDTSSAPYSLDDMADDAAGLLDGLGIRAAHVVGVSMGGAIAQLLTLRHPAKVLSLCSIMSSTGDRGVGQPTPQVLMDGLRPYPPDREGYIEAALATWRVISSPGLFDEARVRARMALTYDRCHCPEGALRQLAAILAAPDRTLALERIAAPTVVIHGTHDVVVQPSGGEATARAIPGARLVLVPGMGHDLIPHFWPLLLQEITDNAMLAAGEDGTRL